MLQKEPRSFHSKSRHVRVKWASLPRRVHQAYSHYCPQLTRWWRICSPYHYGARHTTLIHPLSSAVPSFQGSVKLLLYSMWVQYVYSACCTHRTHYTYTSYGQLKQSIKMIILQHAKFKLSTILAVSDSSIKILHSLHSEVDIEGLR